MTSPAEEQSLSSAAGLNSSSCLQPARLEACLGAALMGLAMLLPSQPPALQQVCQNLTQPRAKGAPPPRRVGAAPPAPPGAALGARTQRGPQGARAGPAASPSRPDIYFGSFAPDARSRCSLPMLVTTATARSPGAQRTPQLQTNARAPSTPHTPTHPTPPTPSHSHSPPGLPPQRAPPQPQRAPGRGLQEGARGGAPGGAARTAGLHAP